MKLDGQEIEQLNLYAFANTPSVEKPGWYHLDAGAHTLRFECVGESPESHGYVLAFDQLAARIPVYRRDPSVDLRTLQKPGK